MYFSGAINVLILFATTISPYFLTFSQKLWCSQIVESQLTLLYILVLINKNIVHLGTCFVIKDFYLDLHNSVCYWVGLI